jgi:hypothetical protein
MVGLYGVGSLDQSLMEIDIFFNLLVNGRDLPFCIMIMNGTFPHPIVPLSKNEATNGFYMNAKVAKTNNTPHIHVSYSPPLISALLPKLRSIAHPLNVSTTLPSHNLESNTFHSHAHGEPIISAFNPTYAASLDHVHLHHNASKIYHHLPIFDLQVTALFFTPLGTKGGL